MKIIDLMFRNPYIRSVDVVEALGVTPPMANASLSALTQADTLMEITNRGRNRHYVADGVLETSKR